uniref:Uncharacterized protein n=1 Tax=Opuntia streptacantha TaxID=393608 RepID=A0A7C9CHW3_OPUST
MHRGYAKIHPLSPLRWKTHPLKNSHKKIPRHTIIGLFNIKLANETRKIGFKTSINTLIGHQGSIQNLTSSHKSMLVRPNNLTNNQPQSGSENFGKDFIHTPNQTNRPEFVDILSPCYFR